MEFAIFPDSGRYYSGSERKKGILINGDCYMVKFQKVDAFGKRFNHISEHIGSNIFKLAGLNSQDTILGTYSGCPVVVCRDFNTEGAQFVPFNDVGESTLEENKERYQYEYTDIMRMLHDNSKLTNVSETISTFWRMYIIDALVGNFDRHGANWGFLKIDNAYSMAPIFDNGACLFPRLRDDDAIREVLNNESEMLRRIYEFPTSQIKLHGKKSSYYEVIASGEFPECNAALGYVMDALDIRKVHDLINDIAGISEIRRYFYIKMIDLRYKIILHDAYIAFRGEAL
ncbi:HipA domain-containing protein [Adlercreutzia sp. ZJ154]|uniref:HipA domain-containing protein n=1 Tax=Adlercreutzia sp. ZJ154 TaxID=2709790 RepID=UPI0013EABB2A|nr:HipA domain-containing protein [Adlercreutzia sp. ZJ154]